MINDQEKAKINSLQKFAPELGEMYRNKEAIRDIFESHVKCQQIFAA